jgi:protocatechuate 3,4-dioxygenase beta subunit
MTPRSTAFGLILLVAVICGAGLLLLRGAFREKSDDIDPRTSSRSDSAADDDENERRDTASVALSGTVLTPSAEPVSGARVDLYALDPDSLASWSRAAWLAGEAPAPKTTAVAEDGSYAFPTLRPGLYGIRAFAPGHACAYATLTQSIENMTVDLTLVEELAISGTVVDAASGRSLAGTDVVAMRVGPLGVDGDGVGEAFLREPRARIRTDENGKFRVGGLLGGTYRVMAIRVGYHQVPKLAPAGGDPVTLQLRTSTYLVGTVVDEEHRPVAGARVLVISHRAGGASDTVSGPDGRFRSLGLSPGTKTVNVQARDFCPVMRNSVVVDLGRETELGEIVLEKGESIAGIVIDDEGTPIAGAVVSARPVASLPSEPVTTGPDGRFECGGLRAGQILLTATCDRYGKYENLSVKPGTRDLEIVLSRTGTLVLRVVSKVTDKPLTSYWAKVHLQTSVLQLTLRNRLTSARRRIEADAEGIGHIEDLAPGKYTAEVGAEGHGPTTVRDLEVPAGRESKEALIELDIGAELRGRVLRKSDDAPVAGATVTVNVLLMGMMAAARSNVTTVTGEDGSFRLGDLPAGPISICVAHPDFPEIENRQVASPQNQGEPVVIRLPDAGRLSGTVYGEDGRPLPGARIITQNGTATVLVKTETTDAEGRYMFENLAPGPINLVWLIDAARGQVRLAQVVVIENEEVQADFFAAGKGATVTGTVKNAKGPVAGVAIVLIPIDASADRGSSLRTGQTDAKGAFELKGLPPGKYILQATENQVGARHSVTLTIPEGVESVHKDLVLLAGMIEGRVLDAKGQPVSEALIIARPDGRLDGGSLEDLALGIVGQAVSAGDGTFRVEGLAAGTYILQVQHGAHGQGRLTGVSLSDGQHLKGVEIKLPAAAELVLVVSGPTGPVNRALVQLTDREGSPVSILATALTGENGRIAVPSVAPGTYRVIVAAKDLAATVVDGVTVAARGITEIPVRMVTGGILRVLVVDEDGIPIPGVRARAENAREGGVPHLLDPGAILRNPPTTGADGNVDLAHVPPGRYFVAVNLGERSARSEKAVEVRDGERSEVRVVLRR